MIKAVIFDMDGVIVDSENLNQRATLKTYRDLGLSYQNTVLAVIAYG